MTNNGYWKYLGTTSTLASGGMNNLDYTEHLLDYDYRTTYSGYVFSSYAKEYLVDIVNVLPLEQANPEADWDTDYLAEDLVVSQRASYIADESVSPFRSARAFSGPGRWSKKIIFSYVTNYYSSIAKTAIPCLVINQAEIDGSKFKEVILSYCGGIAWATHTDRSIYEISEDYYLVVRYVGPGYGPYETMQFICPINTKTSSGHPASIPVYGWPCEDNEAVFSFKNYYSSNTWDNGETEWSAAYISTEEATYFYPPTDNDRVLIGPKSNFNFTFGTFETQEFQGDTKIYTERGIINDILPATGEV